MDGDGEGGRRDASDQCAQCRHARGAAIYIWQLVRSPWPGTRPSPPYFHCPLPIPAPAPVATTLYLTLVPSPTPASRPLLALRSAPYVLSARLVQRRCPATPPDTAPSAVSR
jgi:hypothetical protein